MGVMRKAESGVERAFQGMFGRRAKVNVKPVELAHKLVKEMEDGRVSALSRIYVPHEFTVYLCPQDWARYEPHQESLARQLQNHLLRHARNEGYSMRKPRCTAAVGPRSEARAVRNWCHRAGAVAAGR